jgi:cobalt-zinc-cadmium resistance protein CzcA
MVRKLIAWALNSPLIVVLLTLALALGGIYSFRHVNVEAYPDPAPAIIEIVAQYPGHSAEEVERDVTVPLEVTLAGMPGLKYTRTKSLFGLCHIRNQFEYGVNFYAARQEVINRLQFASGLPNGVNPQISPVTPTGELMRYALVSPRDTRGNPVYSLNDLKAVQDWVMQRQLRRVPRVIDVTGFGGTVKRYEVRPNPDLMKLRGVTLQQVNDALAKSNSNVGGDIVRQGAMAMNVRGLGLLGGGFDPMVPASLMQYPQQAVTYMRQEEQERLRDIRQIVIASVNGVPVRIEDIVEGGPVYASEDQGREGVVVTYQTRLGKVGISRRAAGADGKVGWRDEPDIVQGIVLLRKGEDTVPAIEGAKAVLRDDVEKPGSLLPGMTLPLHFDLAKLIDVTTDTVHENLILGMVLVTIVLLMFLSNVRSALIVAVNIPLALLFAFSVLFLRGKSANLLSIGAVDFGIIVDSSVIMVENIYRHISSGEHAELPLRERLLRASGEVERGLFFSTAIMVCAFLPLFTMQGPEGQIFGPMADTYAFALGGALVLALTLSPVLCLLLFKNLRPARDNFLVRWLRDSYLRQLNLCLKFRYVTLAVFGVIFLFTVVYAIPRLGNEFMPELEEGNVYVRGTFDVRVSLEEVADRAERARKIMRDFPEVELVASQVGRPDDGTDPGGFYNAEFHVPLKPEKDWPKTVEEKGWMRLFRRHRARTKEELVEEMNARLKRELPGVDWNFSQYIRDNVMESLSGVKGDNSVKIIGPDLDVLEETAAKVKAALEARDENGEPKVRGVASVGIFRIKGLANLEFRPDPAKVRRFGISTADVNAVIDAIRGNAVTQVVEGEKRWDLVVRWPERLRNSEAAIKNLSVDVQNNNVTPGLVGGTSPTPLTAASIGLSAAGTSLAGPAFFGGILATVNNFSAPRQPLGSLVSAVKADGRLDPDRKSFVRPGASTISREQGKRLIAVKFSVRGRDLGGAVRDAQEAVNPLIPPGYSVEWSGEFQEMEEANARLMWIIPLSLALIFALLYLAFRSLLDAFLVMGNVVALSVGGVWALLLTGTNFSISAAVGFISIFGVAIMDGLLSVSYFNALRAHGTPLREAILEGAGKRVRPMMMTALTAIFGLLPAAVSTRIGSQTQRPLAIVVVGGMTMALLLNRYLMPVLYSFYGHREPPAGSGNLAH